MEWCGVFMMGLWASGLRSLRPLASTHSVPRLTTPSFSPHINPFRKNSKLKQNISWFGLSFVQISCRKIRSFPFLIDFHSFLPKRARKYHSFEVWSYSSLLFCWYGKCLPSKPYCNCHCFSSFRFWLRLNTIMTLVQKIFYISVCLLGSISTFSIILVTL